MCLYYPMPLLHSPFVTTPDSPNAKNRTDRFKAMLLYVDKMVGQLVSEVDQLGIRERTIIIFTSDNGTDKKITGTRNGQTVVGGKGLQSEAGVIAPFIVNGPGLVPAGVETGTRIRLAGEGEAGMRGGPTGDLYIFIEVDEHELFQREGNHLFCRVPVSMTNAAMGGDIEVPTIDGGRSRVKIPAGSQSGRQMRLRAKGMPALRGAGTGDMFIEMAVETPVNLTSKQKELLREFEKLSEENNPEGSTFFNSVKSFWDKMKG